MCAPLLASNHHIELGHTPVKGYQTQEALMNPVFVVEEDKDTKDKNYCPSIEQWYFIGVLGLQYFFAVIQYYTEKSVSLCTQGRYSLYQSVLTITQSCIDIITHTTLCLVWSIQTSIQLGFLLLYPCIRPCLWLLSSCNLIHNYPHRFCATTPYQNLLHSLSQIGYHAYGIPTALYRLASTGAHLLRTTILTIHKIINWLAAETISTLYAIFETPWHITHLVCATWQPEKKNAVQASSTTFARPFPPSTSKLNPAIDKITASHKP